MARLLRYSFVFGSAVFFAVMWGLLIRSQMPTVATRSFRPDYARLLEPGEDERTTTWTVHFTGRRIGMCAVTVERQTAGLILVTTTSRVIAGPLLSGMFGTSGPIDAEFQATFSPLRGLRSFQASSAALNTRLRGTLSRGVILLSGTLGDQTVNARVPFDEQRLLGQALSPLAALPRVDRMRVGDSWQLDLVNPLSASVQHATITVATSRDIELDGEPTKALELLAVSGGRQWTSWMTKDGDVLVQGTPFGVSLHRADLPEEVMEALTGRIQPPRD